MAQTAGSLDTHISDLVRQGDQDRYWSALLAPETVRGDLLALYAFNLEIARIPDQVSEPQLGEIRLQWWQDMFSAAMQGERTDHPVLDAAAEVARRHGLPQENLIGMIEARGFDLYDDLMPDFAALESYLGATAGALFGLSARILRDQTGAADMLAHEAALAYGLTGLMKALPYHAARGRIFLPQSLLAAHGLHPHAILSGNDNDDLRAALRDMGARVADALSRFRVLSAGLKREIRPAFLTVAVVPPYLKRLTSPAHKPFHDAVQLNPLQRYGLIWKAYLSGRF